VSHYFFLSMTFGLRFFDPLHAFFMHDCTTLNESYHVLQPLSVLLFLDVSCWPYKTHWSFIFVIVRVVVFFIHSFITNVCQ
jgi:hypothetical protein